jgi:signal transduction histidine kinase
VPVVGDLTHDFRHLRRLAGGRYTRSMDLSSRSHRLYRRAVWITALLPSAVLLLAVDATYRTWALAAWAGCYAAFLALLALARRRPRHAVLAALGQSASALAATAFAATTAEGAMLVVVASQLAASGRLTAAVAAASLQTLVFGILLARSRPLEIAVDVPLAWLGFQLFAILLTEVARSEAAGRLALVERNIQLLGARQQLAEQTRAAERLRVARDLHDGLGHHLTALSLNLEAASHLAEGAARDHLHRAQALTRTLLADVRATVGGMREETYDPMPAIRALVERIDSPAVHVEGPPSLDLREPTVADALMRIVQEIVTNTIRHAQAANLWISVSPSRHGIDVEGRDDGRGARSWLDGHGLQGMRERVALVGGSLSVASSPGAGFHVQAHIPLPEIRA